MVCLCPPTISTTNFLNNKWEVGVRTEWELSVTFYTGQWYVCAHSHFERLILYF